MRKEYIKEIQSIEEQMVSMALKSEEAIQKSFKALLNRDLESSKQVIVDDTIINQMEVQIEEAVVRLLTLEGPVAKDFRRVSSVFKIITDLERIGDLATNIAQLSLQIGKEDFIKPLVDLPLMYEKTRKMLKDALKAYVNDDIELAKSVAKKDDEVDDLNYVINQDLLQLISKDEQVIDQALKLMFIARYLERIADHVTNICERIIYIHTNEMLAHKY